VAFQKRLHHLMLSVSNLDFAFACI
jgi:hypothetical protein